MPGTSSAQGTRTAGRDDSAGAARQIEEFLATGRERVRSARRVAKISSEPHEAAV